MHTKSSKAVLAPLADAVSALILILAESELSGSPTPDLSSLSQSVATQITNLNGVVQKIIGSSQDEELKNLMPDGCEQVKKASELLLAGAAELTKNNTSSSGRQQLLEAVKNLLSGTTFILDVYDDSEVRKILIASALVRDCCNELHNKPDANEEQYDLWITKLHVLGQAIIPLAQLATKRIADLVMDTLASQLEKAISQLTRSAPNMASAATIFLLDVENQDHAQTLNFFLTTISDASLEIDAIIQCKGDPAQTLPQCGEHERMLEQHRIHSEAIIDKCKRGEILPADKTTETEFFALSENLLHGYKSTSKFVKNSALESTASRLIESGRQDLSQIEKILDDHEIGVTDPRIGHACKESVYALQAQISSLGSMIPPLVISELLPSLANLVAIDHPNTVSFNLREHALQGHELYGDSLDQFSKETSNVKTVADYLLSTLKPEQSVLYCKVDAESKKLASFADAVGCAARIAFANPKEEAAVSNLNNSFSAFINQAKDLEKTLYEQVFSDKDLIDGAMIAFDTHSSSLEDKIALNNINGTKKEVASTELIANQLLAIVGHEIESSDDGEYREHLKKVAEKVKIRILNFYSELSALMAVANDENAAVGQFSDAVKSMSQNLKDLGDIVKKYKGHVLQHSAGIYEKTEYIEATEVEKVHEVETEQAAPEPSVMSEQEILGIAVTTEVGGDDAIRALTSAIKDLVVSQEAAPLLLPAEEARQDPIKAAGQELKVEAANWSEDENPIIQAVISISQKFLDLSTYHNQLKTSYKDVFAKKAFIQAAQGIMIDTTQFVKAIQPVITACTDKRLRLQIQSSAARLTTLSQQLKIVAAVKASSLGDNDAAVQLISCAQNLVGSIKMALRDCVSCSIRARKESNAEIVGIKFRKVVFARNLLPAGFQARIK